MGSKTFASLELQSLHNFGGKAQPAEDEGENLIRSEQDVTDKKAGVDAYRVGARAAAFCACFALLLNFSIAIWVASKHGTSDPFFQVWQGDCTTASRLDTVIHLIINLLSTFLLSGSNYCMQCLTAPTRSEVDKAHRERIWLDIGVPSTRNLWYISRRKAVVWGLLLLSTLPLHLMYNSAAYSSLSTHNLFQLFVSDTFLKGAAFNVTTLENTGPQAAGVDESGDFLTYNNVAEVFLQGIQANVSTYQNLSNAECIDAYANALLPTRNSLVLVTSNVSSAGSIVQVDYHQFWSPQPREEYNPYAWICTDPYLEQKLSAAGITYDPNTPCQDYLSQVVKDADNWRPYGLKVEYCLSEQVPGTCSLHFNFSIIIIVVISNIVKAACMFYVAYGKMDIPLMTIGDAAASFLERPDETTRNMCLADRSFFTNKEKWISSAGPRPWKSSTRRKASAASRKRWFYCLTLLTIALIIVGALLSVAIDSIRDVHNIQDLAKLGFGTPTPQAAIVWGLQYMVSMMNEVIATVLIANIPQLILSLIYFSINGIFTAMALANEWSAFAETGDSISPKSLRVSQPKGAQRKNYFLQLPYRLGLPLTAMSALLHWFVSQSLFVVIIIAWDYNGEVYPGLNDYGGNTSEINPTLLTCGFSPIAMIAVLIAGGLLLVFMAVWASTKLRSPMPIAGSCSAAISAACHPSNTTDDRKDIALHGLRWGVMVPAGESYQKAGHCGLSDEFMDLPVEGETYAG